MMFIYQLTTFVYVFGTIRLTQASISPILSLKLSDGSEVENYRKIWALIAVGSNGWINYRHQAGACHAFHVLRDHGVADENIILMMYDDIANHKENPNPGKIFNRPGGPNVYDGVKIDYSGSDVTPENFLAVLQGDANSVKGGSGRVIESTSSDRIFIYYVDHGGTGLIEFPNAILTVKDLNDALRSMHEKRKYHQILFYMEACEGGSMFKNVLPINISVYAVTSANEHESAWGCYCDGVGPHMPCLGDVFSVSWMENADVSDLRTEKLKTQVGIARKAAILSHVMEYGNVSISEQYASNFEGWKQRSRSAQLFSDPKKGLSMMPVREIPIMMLRKKLKTLRRPHEKSFIRHKIKSMLKKRGYLKKFFTRLVADLVSDRSLQERIIAQHPAALTNLHCFDDIVKAFHTTCFNFTRNSYALKFAYVLANICEQLIPTETILRFLVEHCLSIQIRNIH
ncbi:Legumain [Toxocara canis]|uniref:legumain n=1 Tax=Toxocara canis TaxID=6265 RepID=A0A0B2V0Q9_TOXCA|nr:Legumain [Toxocara canis]